MSKIHSYFLWQKVHLFGFKQYKEIVFIFGWIIHAWHVEEKPDIVAMN